MTLPARLPTLVTVFLGVIIVGCGTPTQYRTLSVDDLRDAQGWYQFGEFRYRGAVANGQPHGQGEAIFSTGIRVVSYFHRGLPNGMAEVTVPNYGVIFGDMASGVMTRGTAELMNGDIYAGEFRNWHFHGTGTLYRADETRYHGVFQNGVAHGQGVFYDARSQTRISGTFANGQPTGQVFVVNGSTPTVRHFREGRDVTNQVINERAAEAIVAPLQREAERLTTAIVAQRETTEQAEREEVRARTIRDPARIAEFNRECGHCYVRASPRPDGSFELRDQAGCLIVRDSNLPTPTAAEQREFDRRIAEERAACWSWGRNIENPAGPAQLRALRARHQQEASRLAALAEQERRVRADIQRTREAARAAEVSQAHAELRRAIAAERAEADRLAREHQAAHARACAERPNSCGCRILTTPCTSRSCASCQ